MGDMAGEVGRQPELVQSNDEHCSLSGAGVARLGWSERTLGRDHQVARCLRVLRHVLTTRGAVWVAAAVAAAGRATTSWSSSSVWTSVIMQRQVPTVPLR